MVQTWAILAFSLGYVGLLFALAYYGDRRARRRDRRQISKPVVYSLSLAVYCTSWTYYGSVGLSATSGYNFLPIYIGPILLFVVCGPLVRRIVLLSKRHNITSIADFIAARYGKSQWLAATVTVIAVIGIMPYTALQLKAVSTSFTVLTQLSHGALSSLARQPGAAVYTELGVSLLLATFAILFGTRRIEANEHHDGLILAIAFESVVKLLAFLVVGAFVTWGMFGGFGDLASRVAAQPALRRLFFSGGDGTVWMTMTALAFTAALCLPRQFHVTIVENATERDLRKAQWLFPLYLIVINIFVVPIAIAGLSTFPNGSVNGDLFVIALPMAAGQGALALIAFIGGFSAATGMVIVSCVALSTMVSNDLVMPIVLHGRRLGLAEREDMGALIRHIRRVAIVAVMLLGYGYCRLAGDTPALAAIGLLSFAAMAQFAPALLGGLAWRGGNAMGAIAGIVVGFLLWFYCLMLPTLAQSGWPLEALVADGPFGVGFLRPQALFGLHFDPLTNGTLWSLAANIACYVGVSGLFPIRVIERVQASAFVDLDSGAGPFVPRAWRGAISIGELMGLVARYLGAERAQRAFADLAAQRGVDYVAEAQADFQLVRHAEHLLASAIGAPSARLVLALALERRNLGLDAAMGLLDDATAAIQYNRELLQETLETVRQGISVFDRELHLVCWNRHFRDLLALPPDLVRVGVTLQEIVLFAARRGEFGSGDAEEIMTRQLEAVIGAGETVFENRRPDGRVFEIRTNPMIGGGYVTTYTDISEHVHFAAELAAANERLELRVHDRTVELSAAKAIAEEANLGKTRFLAAASHDLLQPLNAARLYVASLLDHQARTGMGLGVDELARKIDTSLGSVEDLLGVLLDISRLDAGVLTADRRDMPLDELFRALQVEFAPIAERKGLDLVIVPARAVVFSDRRLLHRILQNLLSNAIRYTRTGKVLMGTRRAGDHLVIQVADTGIGIPSDRRDLIFQEFQRFAAPGTEHGLGLGLSIVERIGRLLDHPVTIVSEPGRGTLFGLRVPRGGVAPSERPAASVSSSLLSGLERLPVLCIDNDAAVRDCMKILLAGWGCRPILAASLADALAAVTRERTPPMLLVVDFHLEDVVDGLDCIDHLRAQGCADAPAILITADRSEAIGNRAAANGVSLLNKPVKPAALRALAMRLVATRAAAE
ncbi:MAG TPA: NahK/ErcS family hybrid sensor histidine kinase/response regulator [Stellaceae bacterium]|nr:NahK/ErcS family hybrid sensor histidine kinase/response regulator [Stellaceae bacterium]